MKAIQVEKYEEMVWCNEKMDELRKTECLCLNCAGIEDCMVAKLLLGVCEAENTAMAITRCPKWLAHNDSNKEG